MFAMLRSKTKWVALGLQLRRKLDSPRVSLKVSEQTGRFFFDREPRSTHYLPYTRESEQDRRRLWALCEWLTEPAG